MIKNRLKWIIPAAALLSGCGAPKDTAPLADPNIAVSPAEPGAPAASGAPDTADDGGGESKTASVVYENEDYGFKVSLPEDWDGYTVVETDWEGGGETSGGKQTGKQFSLRHPSWTEDDPYQDIPVMTFTPDQWEAVQNEEWNVSAAPMPPEELARNDRYVFALPPRYNFADARGQEEVQKILDDGAVSAE
ncbi:MAG: hypothetical protein LBU36_07355 [Clostridiales bacterium]|jgi:hypothetical protein|nr:hypothetical protein [Clostridiales bacterium]